MVCKVWVDWPDNAPDFSHFKVYVIVTEQLVDQWDSILPAAPWKVASLQYTVKFSKENYYTTFLLPQMWMCGIIFCTIGKILQMNGFQWSGWN